MVALCFGDTVADQGTASELAIAAVVNVVVYRALFSVVRLPGWLGGALAAGSMAVATDPSASARARQLAGVLSSPGAVTVQILRQNKLINGQPACCPNCANGQKCETQNDN